MGSEQVVPASTHSKGTSSGSSDLPTSTVSNKACLNRLGGELSLYWYHMLVQLLGRLRQEDHKFGISLDNLADYVSNFSSIKRPGDAADGGASVRTLA